MPTCMIKSSSYTLNLPSAFFSVITFLFTQLKTCHANMKFEMAKHGKDKDISFLRNAGF
jgi:hypothetical protein